MDLRLFLAVLGRFKWVVAGGAALAVLLAVLAYGTPGYSHGKLAFTPRAAEVWQSEAELLITRASHRGSGAHAPISTSTPNVAVAPGAAEEGYFSTLAPVYVNVGNADVVQGALRRSQVPGSVKATEVAGQSSGGTLPFVVLTALAPTQNDATTLAARASAILKRYVASEQETSGSSSSQHVELEVVKSGAPAVLAKGRKLTTPLLVFTAVLVAALGLAFILENLDPQTAAALGRTPVNRAAGPEPDGSTAHGKSNGRGSSGTDQEPVVEGVRSTPSVTRSQRKTLGQAQR